MGVLRIVAALLIAVILWLLWPDAHAADRDCASWARLVESIEAIPPEQHQWARWLHESDSVTKRYILSARNCLASGKTSAQAWRECGSV